MTLTEREVDKLVFVLNCLVEEFGCNANKDGFSYDDDLTIFVKDSEYETIDFEEGLNFLIDSIGFRNKEEKRGEMKL